MRPTPRRLGILLALALPLALCALPALPADDRRDWVEVTRVIDGDTVVVSLDGREVKVRLIGMDTPETVHPSKPVEYFGKEASAFTRGLLEGRLVRLEYDQQKTDRYGRLLAYVHVRTGKDVVCANREIIRRGYGHYYGKYPYAQEKMDSFREAEREAREARRGLWADRRDEGKAEQKPKAADDSTPVYVTRTGAKYHLEGCRSLSKSKTETTLGEAKKRDLGPCSLCRPPG